MRVDQGNAAIFGDLEPTGREGAMGVRAFKVKVFRVLVVGGLWWVLALIVEPGQKTTQCREKRCREGLESCKDEAVYEFITSLLVGQTEEFVKIPAPMQVPQGYIGCDLSPHV